MSPRRFDSRSPSGFRADLCEGPDKAEQGLMMQARGSTGEIVICKGIHWWARFDFIGQWLFVTMPHVWITPVFKFPKNYATKLNLIIFKNMFFITNKCHKKTKQICLLFYHYSPTFKSVCSSQAQTCCFPAKMQNFRNGLQIYIISSKNTNFLKQLCTVVFGRYYLNRSKRCICLGLFPDVD